MRSTRSFSKLTMCATLTPAVLLAMSGCSSNSGAKAASGKTITIPFISGVTGPGAPYAKDLRVPAEMVVDAYNATNPNFKIKIDFMDDQLNPVQAVTLFQQAVAANPLLIAGDFSGTSLAIAPLANSKKIPYVSTFSSSKLISTANRPWAFTAAPDLVPLMESGMQGWFAHESKLHRIAVVVDSKNTGALAQITAAETGIAKAGGTIATHVTFETGQSDLASVVQKVKSAHADGILIGGFATDAGALLKELARQNIPGSRFVSQVATANGLVQAAGSSVNGAYSEVWFTNQQATPGVVDFVKAFKAKSGGVEPQVVESYEGWQLIVAAIKAADLTGSVEQARSSILNALNSVTVTSPTGAELKFNSQGFLPHPSVLVRLDTSGRLIPVP